jgi:hypothetical protein
LGTASTTSEFDGLGGIINSEFEIFHQCVAEISYSGVEWELGVEISQRIVCKRV